MMLRLLVNCGDLFAVLRIRRNYPGRAETTRGIDHVIVSVNAFSFVTIKSIHFT